MPVFPCVSPCEVLSTGRRCDMTDLEVSVLTLAMFVPMLPRCSWCRVWGLGMVTLSVRPRWNPCVLLLWVSPVPLLTLHRAGGKMRVQFVVILSGRVVCLLFPGVGSPPLLLSSCFRFVLCFGCCLGTLSLDLV